MAIFSKERQTMQDDTRRHELYYLSMFGPKGSGSSLNAIFAGLVSQPSIREIYIEDLGPVALMHRSGRMPGMSPSWSCSFAEFGTNKAIHALVESNAISLWDPQQAIKVKKVTPQDGGSKKLRQVASKEGEMSEKVARVIDRRPIFFMMVPPGEEASKLHLSYLDKRCPFPLIDEWAPFLWDRALKTPEIEELEVWAFTPDGTSSLVASAYLCFPDLEKIMKDLSLYIREGSREEVAA
jgi:hypothetical protein